MLRSLGFTLALALAGLQLTAVTVIIASSYVTSERVLLDHARDMLHDVATAAVQHSRSFLAPASVAAELARRLAENEVVASDDPFLLEKLLFQQLQTAPQFSGVYYGDQSGNFVFVSRAEEEGLFLSKIISVRGGLRTTELAWRDTLFNLIRKETNDRDDYDPRKRPWYTRAKNTKDIVWTDPYIFFTSEKPGITVASPVLSASGDLSGVVGVDIEIAEISQFLSQLRIGERGSGIILNHNGDVIAHPDPELLMTPSSQGGLRLVNIAELDDPVAQAAFGHLAHSEEIALKQETSASFKIYDEAYVATLTPTISKRLPWTIGVYAPEADFTNSIRSNRRNNILVALLVAAITALVGLWLARCIHHPVRELADRANQIAVGKLEPPGPFPQSFREIDQAGEAFVGMSRALANVEEERDALTAQLRAASKTLEKRVEERTAELETVNALLKEEVTFRSLAEQSAFEEATLHRKTAERLRVAMEDATVANDAKTRFLSSMSHELRNPLNAIIGFSEVLMNPKYQGTQAERENFLKHVNASGTHLLALVNDVLDLERVEAGRMHLTVEPVDPVETLAEVIAEQSGFAAEGSVTVVDRMSGTDLPALISDRIRLRQILGNVLNNAIKYNHDGGRVEIRAEKRGPDLRVVVEDTGIGIARDLHDRVFEPFDRLGIERSNIEGTGVGLALSKKLIESLGGRIGFDSAVGSGSTFWFDVPVLIEDEPGDPPAETAPTPETHASDRVLRVLYIDDNAVNLELIKTHLALRPYIELSTALDAGTGMEAMIIQDFDVVLLDLNLPDISGLELVVELRNLRPNATYVAVSADAMPEQIERGLQAGFDDYITKPVDLRALDLKLTSLFSGQP